LYINRWINFSRSKKDKTSDKRDVSEDKKNNETDASGTNSSYMVGISFFFISIFDLFIFYVKKSGYKTTTDEDFQMYLDEIRPQIAKVPLSEQISTLAR
jgi:hypothetical protein